MTGWRGRQGEEEGGGGEEGEGEVEGREGGGDGRGRERLGHCKRCPKSCAHPCPPPPPPSLKAALLSLGRKVEEEKARNSQLMWPGGEEQRERMEKYEPSFYSTFSTYARYAAETAQIEQFRSWVEEMEGGLNEMVGKLVIVPGRKLLGRRALTAEEEGRVDDALMRGLGEEVLVELNDIPVRRGDMRTLAPGEWLNDEVVNNFFEILKVRMRRGEGNETREDGERGGGVERGGRFGEVRGRPTCDENQG